MPSGVKALISSMHPVLSGNPRGGPGVGVDGRIRVFQLLSSLKSFHLNMSKFTKSIQKVMLAGGPRRGDGPCRCRQHPTLFGNRRPDP